MPYSSLDPNGSHSVAIFDCHKLGWAGAEREHLAEAKDAVKRPTVHRTATTPQLHKCPVWPKCQQCQG